MQPTEPTAAPSFLEKLGAEALDVVIPLAQSEEPTVLAFVDGEIAAGATDLGQAFTKALSSKIPLIGATIGGEITAALAGLDASADGAVKSAFDKIIAALQAKAKAWGG